MAKRCEDFSTQAVSKALGEREKRAEKLLELDELVNECVKNLKEAGLKSPYLKVASAAFATDP